MGKRLYQIILWGSEDSRECRMMLTAEEADILCRLEDELHPLKGYVPHIVVVDIEKSEEEARKLEEKKAAEAKAKLDHAMGLDRTFETSMAAAFRKAKSKKATEQKGGIHMKTITVMGADGNTHEITLTLKDIIRMQTPEIKRTLCISANSVLASVVSMFMPRGTVKYATLGLGVVLAIATGISANDATNKAVNQENLDRINEVLRDVCTREGFEYCC